MKKSLPYTGLAMLAAATLVGIVLFPSRKKAAAAEIAAKSNQARAGDFVGAETCSKCHAQQYGVWQRSTHGRAGGKPGRVDMIAPFDAQPLRFKDAVVTPTTNAQGDYVFFVQLEGAPQFEVKVDAVVGGGHMYGGGTQSFFNEYPDGTWRFLPFDFSRQGNIWFTQSRKDKTWVPIAPELSLQTDALNWPPSRVLGTSVEFSNCQNCHGTQIALGYDATQRKHQTHFQALQINCESCHGPGRRHVEIVSKPGFEKLADIGMEPLALKSKDASLMICFQCHTTKDAIREGEYLPGQQLEDYFSVKLPVFADNPYLVDGRIRTFGYQGNHLYSDCYLNGSMTCVDCHDPHSLGYRDTFQRPLTGKFDNGQCTGCHASKAITPEAHSHHLPGSRGTQCVSCHMPFLQHHGVGKQIQFARSDHTIPIPRPAFDAALGIENACAKCHGDKDIAWQQNKVREWYGDIKPHHPLIAALVAADKNTDTAQTSLLAPDAGHPMAQMDGLATFVRKFVKPNRRTPGADKLHAFAKSSDPDLQALALMALHVSGEIPAGGANASSAVKNRWGIMADQFGSIFLAAKDVPSAVVCFERSLEVIPDNIVTLSHLAFARANEGDLQNAAALLKRAIAARPHTANLYFQLAQICLQLQERDLAIKYFEQGLSYAPENRAARALLMQLRAAPN